MTEQKKKPTKLRPNKYGVSAKAARTLDGITFSSKLEMNRYAYLKIVERTGSIKNLKLQPRYCLQESFSHPRMGLIRAIHYVADFEYERSDGTLVTEDTKGVRTEAFGLKLKMFLRRFQDRQFFEIKTYNEVGGIFDDPKTVQRG